MEHTEPRASKRRSLAAILALVVAYIASRALFAAFGFRYEVFREPFDLGKLVVDFGVWAVIYGAAWWGFIRLLERR